MNLLTNKKTKIRWKFMDKMVFVGKTNLFSSPVQNFSKFTYQTFLTAMPSLSKFGS